LIFAFVNAGTSLISEAQAPIDRPGHEHEQAVVELDDTIREATFFAIIPLPMLIFQILHAHPSCYREG
jgi:hypothetical protein